MAGGFPLGTRVEFDFGGWTDVTSRVLARDPITITRGGAPSASSTDPATCRLTLRNYDDAFSMRNPASPYAGYLTRNVPVRVSLPADVAGLQLRYEDPANPAESRAYANDAAGLAVTADLDVRVEADADQWRNGQLASKYRAVDGQREWALFMAGGKPTLVWSPDGTFPNRKGGYGTVTVPDPSLPARRAVRAVLALATGTVTYYTADTISGPWTLLETVVTGTGATSVAHGAAPMEVGRTIGITGTALPGRVVAAQVLVGGTMIASPNFADEAAGAASFSDAQGNVWNVATDAEITDRDTRFYGEVSQWPQYRDVAGADKTVDVTASSLRRRLSLNAPTLDSVMVREFSSPRRANIVAYWSLEDAAGATAMASGLPGAAPMRIYGTPKLGAYSDWLSSRPVPYMGTGAFLGNVPAYDSSQNEIALRLFVDCDAAPSSDQNLITLRTTTLLWDIDLNASGDLRVRALTNDEETVLLDSGFSAFDLHTRGFVSIAFELTKNGTAVHWKLIVIDFQGDETWYQNIPTLTLQGDVTGREVGRATQVTLGRDKNLGNVAVGHLAIANDIGAYSATGGALNTWNGETAEERVARLSREEGITVRLIDGAADDYINGHALGKQTADTWLDLVEEVEASDLGIFLDARAELGFGYRTRYSLVNQPAKLSLDYDSGEIAGDLRPVDDDDTLVNDVTVKRIDGGSYHAEDTTSGLSVLPPPFGVGRYAAEVDVSAQADAWLPSQAGFRLRFGTVDRERYPVLSVDLHSPRVSDAQAKRVRALDIGDRADLLHADAWTPSVAQIVTGYTEELHVVTHRFEFNLTPADGWTAAVVDTDRYDTAGSELATGVDDGTAPPDPLGVPRCSWAGAGVANGALTTATAGTGDRPFDSVTAGAFTVSSEQVQMDQAAGSGAYVAWTSATTGAGYTRYGVRATVTFSAYPSGNARWLLGVGASSSTLWWLDMTATGIVRLKDPGGVTLAQSASPVPLNTAIRVDVLALDGALTATLYSGAATLATLSGTLPGTLLEVRFGNPQASPTWPRMWWDDMALTDPDTHPFTGLYVRTTVGPRWVDSATYPDEFPFDVVCGGEQMTVTAIAPSVADAFGRTVAAGVGNADSGQQWTTSGGAAADYSVGSGVLSVANPSTGIAHAVVMPAPSADLDAYVDVTTSVMPTGASLFGGPVMRWNTNANWYMARLEFTTSAGILLTLRKRVGNVETVLSSVTTSLTHAAGTFVRVRFQIAGTTLRVKAWAASAAEPPVWHLSATDSDLSDAQSWGTRSFSNTGNSNASPAVQYDNVKVVNPQAFTVTRGVNGVLVAHAAGAEIALAEPAYVTL